MKGKLLIFSAPSGSGKTTLLNHVMANIPEMAFSVSATTRPPRGEEVNGREYYFLTMEDFKQRVENGEFLEWEEVYPGRCYGTLLSVVAQMQEEGKHVAFDVDVCGGVNIKNHYGDQALSVFIQAPSIEALRERLINRQTDYSSTVRPTRWKRLRSDSPRRLGRWSLPKASSTALSSTTTSRPLNARSSKWSLRS